MNYAAATHLAPAPGSPAGGDAGMLMPWETDTDLSAARHDTWLLSFIDILALLLTLFVLLLAHEHSRPVHDARPVHAPGAPFDFSRLLQRPVATTALLTGEQAGGFALPGNGLLPLTADSGRDKAAADAPAPAADRVSPATLAASEPPSAGSTPALPPARPVDPDGSARSGDTPAPPPEQQRLAADATVDTTADTTADTLSVQHKAAPVARPRSDALLETFKRSELGGRVEVNVRPGAVSLEISDSILFRPASAALSGDGTALLDQLAEILRTLPYNLSVEGHTDNVPIHTSRYPSNWELSAARAAMVTRKLIEQGVAADRVRAIGYGDTRPRSDNHSAEGRAKNRRVTFVLQVPEEK